jgi:orotate phosphoribosyltransferase
MNARDELLTLLRAHSFQKKRVILASGRESDFFIDCKQTILQARAHTLVGQVMLPMAAAFAPRAVAGVELGGCPLASAVAYASAMAGAPLDAVYVRKDAKDHGSRRDLEGNAHLAPGTRIVLLEDVITTGGSTLKAIAKLRDAGYELAAVLCLVDRDEGGREAIAESAEVEVRAVFGRLDFMECGTVASEGTGGKPLR